MPSETDVPSSGTPRGGAEADGEAVQPAAAGARPGAVLPAGRARTPTVRAQRPVASTTDTTLRRPTARVPASAEGASPGARVAEAASVEPSRPIRRAVTRTRVYAASYGVTVTAGDRGSHDGAERSVRIRVRVVDDAGIGVAGASVRLSDRDAERVVETDSQGRVEAAFDADRTVDVRLGSVPRGYSDGARHPEHATLELAAVQLVLDAAEPLLECTMEVSRVGSATLRIPGLPRNARWVAYPTWTDSVGGVSRAPHGTLAQVGEGMRFDDLPCGEVDLHVHVADVGSGVAHIHVRPSEVTAATLHLTPGGAAVTASLPALTAADEVRVSLTELVTESGRSSMWDLRLRRGGPGTMLSGRVSGLRPGTYVLGVAPPAVAARVARLVEIPAGESTFVLRALPASSPKTDPATTPVQVTLTETASLRGRFSSYALALLLDGKDDDGWVPVRVAGEQFPLAAGRYVAVTWTGKDRFAPWGGNWRRDVVGVDGLTTELRIETP